MKKLMKRRRHSKSSLFLMELMISILFFSITAAVFLQAFVKSDLIRKESRQLFYAQTLAGNAAEILKHGQNSEKKLEDYYPDSLSNEKQIIVFFDQEWKNCKADVAVNQMTIEWQEEDFLKKYKILVSSLSQSHIYSLELSKWLK